MNSEEQVYAQLCASIAIAVEGLTNDDLAGLNMCAQLDLDPRGKPWYGQIDYLFTERDGTRMHDVAKSALASIVIKRLS